MSAKTYTHEQIEQLAEAWPWLENSERSNYNIPALLRQLLAENEALRKDGEVMLKTLHTSSNQLWNAGLSSEARKVDGVVATISAAALS